MPKYRQGQSGNPSGRPVGSKNQVTKLREAIADDLPEIIAGLVNEAKIGNVAAAGLLLDRCLPRLRPVTEEVDALPADRHSLGERADAIATAALAGEISPTVASELMAMLAQQGRILEINELMQRIERLEKALAATKGKK